MVSHHGQPRPLCPEPRCPGCVAYGCHNPVPQPGGPRQFWTPGVRDHGAGEAKEGAQEGLVLASAGCGNSGASWLAEASP